MKKLIISALLALLVSTTSFNRAHAQAYEKGDWLLSAGFTFGYYGYGYLGSRSGFAIPLTANLEKGIHEYISIGPYVGYASWRYDFGGFGYRSNFLSFGGRGSFHYLPLLNEVLDAGIDEDKIDFYVTLIVGVETRSFTYDDGFSRSARLSNEVQPVFGPVLGFRYMFNRGLGVFFEGGRGAFGYGTLGLTGRF